MNAPTPGPDNPHAVRPIPEQAPPPPIGTVDPSAAVLVAQVTCPSCGVVASYTFGHRAPDVCQSCGQPYQFTTERRVELDAATGHDAAGLDADGTLDPRLAEAARRISALGGALNDLPGGSGSDEVDLCRDLARVFTDPDYRSAMLTDEVASRLAAAILGEVEPR